MIVIVTDIFNILYASQALFRFFNIASLDEFTLKYNSLCSLFLNEKNSITSHKNTQESSNRLLELAKQKRQIALLNDLNEMRYFNIYVKPIFNERYVVTLHDITSATRRNQFLENKAYHDALTGVFNRQYFYEYVLKEEITKTATVGIIITDIDNFKSINDTFGHNKGDEVLKTFTATLLASLRPNDTVIRWGGEEFIIIVNTASKEELSSVAQKLRKAVEEIIIPDICPFTSSFGATLLLEDENIDNTIARADKALYKAKANGKNRVELL